MQVGEVRRVLVEEHLAELHAPFQRVRPHHLVGERLQQLVGRVLATFLAALLELELDGLPNLPVLEPEHVRIPRRSEVQNLVDDVAAVTRAKPAHVEDVQVVVVVLADAHAHGVVRLLPFRDGEVPRLVDVQLASGGRRAVVAEHLLVEEVALVGHGVLLVERVPHALLTACDEVALDAQHRLCGVARRVDRRALLARHACACRYEATGLNLHDAVVFEHVLVAVLVDGWVAHDLELVAVARVHGFLDAPRPVVRRPPGHDPDHAPARCETGVGRGQVPLPGVVSDGDGVCRLDVFHQVIEQQDVRAPAGNSSPYARCEVAAASGEVPVLRRLA